MKAPHTSLVHFYDTIDRRIMCGVRGVDHHSTKHSRSVTCQACVALLIKQARPEDALAGNGAMLEPLAH